MYHKFDCDVILYISLQHDFAPVLNVHKYTLRSKGVGVTGLWVSGLTGFGVMKKTGKGKHRRTKMEKKNKG